MGAVSCPGTEITSDPDAGSIAGLPGKRTKSRTEVARIARTDRLPANVQSARSAMRRAAATRGPTFANAWSDPRHASALVTLPGIDRSPLKLSVDAGERC